MALPDFIAQQQSSSWRGVPFVTEDYSIKTGREIALHRYAFRDLPWPEDMSKALQVYSFTGFVGGSDSWMEDFLSLKSAVEDQRGADTLVHPFLGSLNAACVGAFFSASHTEQRLHRVQLEFVICAPEKERARQLAAKISTQDAIKSAVADAEAAFTGDFVENAGSALRSGKAAVMGVRSTIQGYANEALRITRDATGALNAVKGLSRAVGLDFGRFNAGPMGTLAAGIGNINRSLAAATRAEAGVSRLLAAASRARGTVEGAAARLTNTLGAL